VPRAGSSSTLERLAAARDGPAFAKKDGSFPLWGKVGMGAPPDMSYTSIGTVQPAAHAAADIL